MAQPLKNKLTCSICNLFVVDCQCKDSDGDKYEPDLEQDIFIGSDVQSAVEWLKLMISKMESGRVAINRFNVIAMLDEAFPDLNTDVPKDTNEVSKSE